MRNTMRDNEIISNTIALLEGEGNYQERKPYLAQLNENKFVSVDGFAFAHDVWCWVVSTTSDDDNDVYKVVPRFIKDKEAIKTILKAQKWIRP